MTANGDNERFVISASGVRMPRIIYGTAWKKTQTEALVTAALEEGFRGIDTACQPRHYDEAGVGRAVTAALADGLDRSAVFLQTKFTPLAGHDPSRVPYDPSARIADQVARSFETSLANLAVSHVDSLVLHSPLGDAADMADAWRAMEAIHDAGGAAQLGISNCYDAGFLARLHETARVGPAVVQNRFYAKARYDRDVRAVCAERGIVYQSFWTLTANPHVLAHGDVAAIAARRERTPAQVLFRYVTQQNIVPLTGTTSRAHMREDLEIFEFSLSDDEQRAVAALLV